MSERYTKRDAERAFEALAEACGATVLDYSWPITDERRDGAWKLDHNGVYGGYVIAAILPSSPPHDDSPQTYTAETHPLDSMRRPAREFAQTCWMATRAIGFARTHRNGGHTVHR
jgi:hypothetical protein